MGLLQRYLGSPAPFPLIPVVLETPEWDMKILMPQIQLSSGLRMWFLFLSDPAIIDLNASLNHPCGSFFGQQMVPKSPLLKMRFYCSS